MLAKAALRRSALTSPCPLCRFQSRASTGSPASGPALARAYASDGWADSSARSRPFDDRRSAFPPRRSDYGQQGSQQQDGYRRRQPAQGRGQQQGQGHGRAQADFQDRGRNGGQGRSPWPRGNAPSAQRFGSDLDAPSSSSRQTPNYGAERAPRQGGGRLFGNERDREGPAAQRSRSPFGPPSAGRASMRQDGPPPLSRLDDTLAPPPAPSAEPPLDVEVDGYMDEPDSMEKDRRRRNKRPEKERKLPARDWGAIPSDGRRRDASQADDYVPPPPPKAKPAKVKLVPQAKTQVFLPSIISVSNLARLLGVKMRSLQNTMRNAADIEDTRPDALLNFEQAELVALEYNLEAVANEEAAFDLYPRPALDAASAANAPLRPPIVTVMGHVDHGKTTLLDTLRKTSVAAGEAGGITQHIGAFSVPVSKAADNSSSDAVKTVTFLDTPGHAAFTAMRSRGASVTDIIVLVVAADDGVMPQTEEVIALWKELAEIEGGGADADGNGPAVKTSRGGQAHAPVQLVVALNKIDKPDADPGRVKRDLLAKGVELEEFSGDVPCVEVSGKMGLGLEDLEETLATLAELAELRAERDGPAEGYVLESRVEKGRGNLATVLVKRGALKAGDCLIAGTSWCKVRQIFDSNGKIVKTAMPGDPVLVAGWRELPTAGDELLGSTSEADVKRAVANRKDSAARRALVKDAEEINEARRLLAEDVARGKEAAYQDRVRRRAIRAGEEVDPLTGKAFGAGNAAEDEAEESEESERKELRLLVKADVSGTVEAVIGAIQGIGNAEAGVRIIASGVGEPTEGDVARAQASEASILCFNLSPPNSLVKSAARLTPPVPIHADTVIYRLMDHVSAQVAALLPPKVETRVLGEAQVAQIFAINVRGRVFRNIAGCRVTNGQVQRNAKARVLRGKERKIVYDGRLETLKHVKKDVEEMRKGTECGMAFEGFEDLQVDDVVQCYTTFEVPRKL